MIKMTTFGSRLDAREVVQPYKLELYMICP
jgi:hypothetical protein